MPLVLSLSINIFSLKNLTLLDKVDTQENVEFCRVHSADPSGLQLDISKYGHLKGLSHQIRSARKYINEYGPLRKDNTFKIFKIFLEFLMILRSS